jgi:hypothetical protein
MSKPVLARGNITNTDELVIILSEPDNEPAAVLIRWPAAASVASVAAFPTTASKITAVVAGAAVGSRSTTFTSGFSSLFAAHELLLSGLS